MARDYAKAGGRRHGGAQGRRGAERGIQLRPSTTLTTGPRQCERGPEPAPAGPDGAAVAQLVRALDCGSRGPWFESRQRYQ